MNQGSEPGTGAKTRLTRNETLRWWGGLLERKVRFFGVVAGGGAEVGSRIWGFFAAAGRLT